MKAPFQTILKKGLLLFGLAEFFLLFNEQSVSVFECIFCPTLKRINYLRPLLLSTVLSNERQ